MEDLASSFGSEMSDFHILATPSPSNRPRVGKFGTYYGKTYKAYKAQADQCLKSFEKPATDKPLVVFFEIATKRPKTSKRKYPRGDWDNYGKGPSDSLQGFAWNDDDQIIQATVLKRWAIEGEEPGIYAHWFGLNDYKE